MSEKTIDLVGDEAFSAAILARRRLENFPANIYDEAVTSLRDYALSYLSGIESVSFPNVTSIGESAFSYNHGMKRAEFANCTTFMGNVFRQCEDLEEVVAPKLRSIGEYGFVWSPKMKRAEFPQLVSVGSGCFYGCTDLEEVILPRLQVLYYAMFLGCNKLTQIDLPSVTTIRETCLASDNPNLVLNLGPNISSINTAAFSQAPAGMVLNLPVAEGEIAGAPWGGAGIVINYNHPYSGTVPIPEDIQP